MVGVVLGKFPTICDRIERWFVHGQIFPGACFKTGLSRRRLCRSGLSNLNRLHQARAVFISV